MMAMQHHDISQNAGPPHSDELLDSDEIHDPALSAFVAYIEAAAHKVAVAMREDTEPSTEDIQADAPEPLTDEYDLENGIPHYELP